MQDKTLPKVPFYGLEFTPYGTNSIGTVLEVMNKRIDGSPNVNISGAYNGNIRYSYAHNPKLEFVEPWADVRKFAHEHMLTIWEVTLSQETLDSLAQEHFEFTKSLEGKSATEIKEALNNKFGKVTA